MTEWITAPKGGSGALPKPKPFDPKTRLWHCKKCGSYQYTGELPPADLECANCKWEVEVSERAKRVARISSLRWLVWLRSWWRWI